VLIGSWAVISQIVIPLGRLASGLYRNPRLRTHRTRAYAAPGLILAAAIGLLALPLPQATTATGVLWLPEHARLRAETDCFVEAVLAEDGKHVGQGEPLMRCEDPFLEAEVATLEARLRELIARKTGERLTDLVRSEIVKEEITTVRAGLERAQERQAGLVLRSPVEGRFILPFGEDLPGSFVRQGDTLAYIVADDTPTVRVVVPQADIGLVRERTDGVEIRLAERPLDPIAGQVKREVPAAVTRLPSPALGSAGGGPIEVDPADADGVRARDRVFQLDVVFAEPSAVVGWGGRAQVRFDHGLAPLATQWYARLRQLFLRELSV
jgi:putative peptide zinc metalloprotease protein